MPLSDEFLAYIIDLYSGWGGVSARKMFGGAGLYRDGNMFGLIADDVLYLKAGGANIEDFIRAGSSPFKPHRDKGMTMSYYEAPAEIIDNPGELITWSAKALSVQLQSRAKHRKSR